MFYQRYAGAISGVAIDASGVVFVTDGNRIRRVFAEDQKLVPNVLGQLEFMADLGLNAAVFKCFWPLGRRPDDHPGLSALDL